MQDYPVSIFYLYKKTFFQRIIVLLVKNEHLYSFNVLRILFCLIISLKLKNRIN